MDYTWLRAYHTNRRHGEHAADCGDCQVGKCEVPDLVAAYVQAQAAAAQLAAAWQALVGKLDWACLRFEPHPDPAQAPYYAYTPAARELWEIRAAGDAAVAALAAADGGADG